MAGFFREVAKRVFAEELKSSNCSFRDGEEQNQYAPSYLLTPTGAKCNRVFVVGTLTEKDDIGTDTEYWRGRVVDPTGSIFIYAGQYQPEAAQTLAGLEPPEFVAVVGKPNLYQTEEGKSSSPSAPNPSRRWTGPPRTSGYWTRQRGLLRGWPS